MTYDQPTLDLYLAHRGALIDYAQPIVGCRSRAEDVVQEAYLRFAHANPGQVDQGWADRQRAAPEQIRHPAGYLYRIVRNLALDWARRRVLEGEAPAPEQLEHLPAAAPTPEQAVVDRDQLRRLMAALDELPARTKQAFEMHRLEGWTFPDIARHLDISVGFAHRLVKQALTHCASRLEEPERSEATEP